MIRSAARSARPRPPERGGIFFRLLGLLGLVVLLGALYLARHPLLRLSGSFWIVDEEPIQSDVIVILGDDNFNAERAARAAELFKSGFAPRVLASGRFLRPYASIAEALGMTLVAVRVTVHRLRQRFHELLRSEISNTAETPNDVEDELRYLRRVLAA